MKILYNVQVSNFTIVDNVKKWMIEKDACMNLARGISKSILDIDSSVKFIFKVPKISDVYDIISWYDLFEKEYHNNISFYEEIIPISPVESRFHFDFNYHLKNKEIFKEIDVCINDENTLTKNWIVLFDTLNLNIPIISTNYFLDSPLSKKVKRKCGYYDRQMESFIYSDIPAFQCEASKREALEAMSLNYNQSIVDSVNKKASVWGVGACANEIWKYKDIEKFEIPTIYFGNRITESAHRYTNWHTFCEAIGIISQKYNKPFRAVILNPTNKISEEQKKEILEKSNNKIEIGGVNFGREDYLKFINQAHISVGLFTNEVHGGITHVEAMLSNNMVIMPYINNYADKFSDKTEYEFWCDTYVDDESIIRVNAESLAEKLLNALEIVGTDKEKEINNLLKDRAYERESYERAAERILEDCMKVCN